MGDQSVPPGEVAQIMGIQEERAHTYDRFEQVRLSNRSDIDTLLLFSAVRAGFCGSLAGENEALWIWSGQYNLTCNAAMICRVFETILKAALMKLTRSSARFLPCQSCASCEPPLIGTLARRSRHASSPKHRPGSTRLRQS